MAEVSPDPKRSLTSAAEVAALLRRALDARRLYVPGHPSIVSLNESLHARLSTHLLEFGPLELIVSSLALSIGDKPVLQAERREESISHALFLDGVRSLAIQPRITLDELSKLTGIWHDTLHPTADDGQTFATRLWEVGLAFVKADTVDALVDNAAEAEELEALLASMHAGKAPFREVPAGRLASQLSDRGSFEADINARPAAQSNMQLFQQAFSAEEARLVADEVNAQRGEGTLRTIWALVRLSGVATPDQVSRIEKGAADIFSALGRAGAITDLANVVRTIAQTIRAERRQAGARPSPILFGLLQQLDQPELINATFAALSDEATRDSAMEIMRLLPPNAVGHLLDALAQQTDPMLRKQLVEVISGLLPTAEPLARRVATADPEVAQLILQIAQAMPVQDRVHVTGLGLKHASPAVKGAALKLLKTADVPTVTAVLRPLAGDADPGVRRTAMDLLIRARDPEAARLLGARLEDAKVPAAERKTIYVALGTIGGDISCLALRTEFRNQKDAELRGACALALAQAGDEYSRPVLQATAKKLLTPRALKEACNEALRRLDSKKTQRPAGESSP